LEVLLAQTEPGNRRSDVGCGNAKVARTDQWKAMGRMRAFVAISTG
jgi:hypothetical protein